MEEQENGAGKADEQQGRDDKIRLVDAKYSDAASSNQRDTEMLLDADKAAAPSYELHTENENRLKKEEQPESKEDAENPQQAQGDSLQIADPDETAKYGEELGGTTNLSPDQLEKEGGSAGTDESEQQ